MFGISVELIYIWVVLKSNGIISLVLGCIGLCVVVLWLVFFFDWLFLVGIFIISVVLVCLFVGYFKICEFDYSLEIVKDYIIYCYCLGSWCIYWDNLLCVDCFCVCYGLEYIFFEIIGFKIKSYMDFFNMILLWFVMYLLME